MVFRQNAKSYGRKAQVSAYQEGISGFNKGKLSNPYPINSERNRSWEYGFNKAYFLNLKQVKENERTGKRGKKVYKQKTQYSK